jgi:uncharacterized membrane protein YoaK (UPF0700 family)
VLGAWLGGRALGRLATRTRWWLSIAFGIEAAVLAICALSVQTGLMAVSGSGRLVTIAVLGVALGTQGATARTLGEPDLTTTVLTLTITGLISDGGYRPSSGTRPFRRIGAVVSMLCGAAVGALIVQHSTSAAIGLAALTVAAVSATFASGMGTDHALVHVRRHRPSALPVQP